MPFLLHMQAIPAFYLQFKVPNNIIRQINAMSSSHKEGNSCDNVAVDNEKWEDGADVGKFLTPLSLQPISVEGQ